MRTVEGRFRAILALSTAAMMLWSWPLWLEGTGMRFPRVPFVAGMIRPPVPIAFFRFVFLMGSITATSLGVWPRRTMGVALLLMAWLVVEDQFRLQPWIYQFLLMGLAIAAVPAGQAMGLCRLLMIATYFHSGLSKLDYAFVHEMGENFLATVLGWFGRMPNGWPPMLRIGAILAMPAWEIAVALGLIFRMTRKAAVVGAVLIHLALIAILGPGGLNHSTIVLFWNIATIAEILLLFGPGDGAPPLECGSLLPLSAEPGGRVEQSGSKLPHSKKSPARFVFLLAILLPLGERWGIWDTWPSFALYASHNERMICDVPGEWDQVPEEIPAGCVRPVDGNIHGGWLRVDLKAWSLAERRVPVYPQGRALNGVAESLANRYRVRVSHRGRAELRTGKRAILDLIGAEAIRRHGDSYRLNAHPMP